MSRRQAGRGKGGKVSKITDTTRLALTTLTLISKY